MKDAVMAALSGQAAVVFADDAAELATTLAALRAAAGGPVAGRPKFVLLIVAPTVPNLDRAMLLAAVGPLAVESAPAVRIGALDVAGGADDADVVAAGQFLTTAASTTGQVIRITPR